MFKIKTPEQIAALSAADLAAYIAEAKAHAQSLIGEDRETEPTTAEVDEAFEVLDSVEVAETRLAEVEAEDTARADRLAQARGRLAPKDEDGDDGEDDGEDDSGDDPADPDDKAEVEDKEPALVASTTPKPKVDAAARVARRPKPPAPAQRGTATIEAGIDAPGLVAGAAVTTIADLALPVGKSLESLSRFAKPKAGANRVEKTLASITLGRIDGLVQTKEHDDQSLMYRAASEKRLEGGNLVAAGGWCAPSETIYDLCGGETLEGLWSVPSIQVNRGGVSFTKGPQFSDFYAGAHILQTEAQAEAGTEKECVEISCPDFDEVRLDAFGVCITVPILTNSAYPELVQRWIEGTLIAHEHRKSMNLLNRALTIAGAATTVANPWPAASQSILTAIELVVQGERQRYRLGLNETLEAVFPFWVKAAIRADLANRLGLDTLSVTDEQINALFSSRGVNAQFVYGWQPLVGTSSGAGPVIDFPSTLEVLIYPAGTFVQGTKDVITLNSVYDSVGLSTNVYTGLFTEEGISLMNMCYSPRRISIALEVTGLTAGQYVNQDWGTAEATQAYPVAAFTSPSA